MSARPPPLTGRERLRLCLRAPAAALWLAAMFALFLIVRGVDLAATALPPRRPRALAPFVVHAWAYGAMPLLGLRFRRTGTPMRHPGAIVANHAGWIDIVVLLRAMRVFFVSKSEVARWPAIGFIARSIGTMFIERRAAEAGRQTLALHARLARGDRLAIFPEGTSTDGLHVLPFKSALFGVFFAADLHDRLWVQPVSISYRPGPGLPPAFLGWWGAADFAEHLTRVLARSRRSEVEVRFHPPLRAADFPNRKALAEAAEAAVRAGHRAAALPDAASSAQ